MNLYLSLCHLLALLESPLTMPDFQSQARQNLLFQQGCASMGQCLWFLTDEGILNNDQDSFKLSQMGLLLYTHLLEWTQRDKQKIQQARDKQLKATPEDAVSPVCPACQQRHCALYILTILIERLYRGLATRRLWQPGEEDLVKATLHIYANGQDTVWLLAETYPFSAWLETEQAQVRQVLLERLPQADTAELESIVSQFSQPHILKPIADLEASVDWVSRLQLDYGLLPAQDLSRLRALANPYLYQCLETDADQWEPAVFIRLARPALSDDLKWAYLPLRVNAELDLLIWHLQSDQSWLLVETIRLSKQQQETPISDQNNASGES